MDRSIGTARTDRARLPSSLIDAVANPDQHVGGCRVHRLLIAARSHLLRDLCGVGVELKAGLNALARDDVEALSRWNGDGIASDLGRQAGRAAGDAKAAHRSRRLPQDCEYA